MAINKNRKKEKEREREIERERAEQKRKDRRTGFQIFRGVRQKDDSTLVAIRRLVHHVHLQVRQFRRRLLKHLAQTLDGHLQIPLVILEDLRQVVSLQIKGKGVGPFQGLPTLLQRLRGRIQELHLDP